MWSSSWSCVFLLEKFICILYIGSEYWITVNFSFLVLYKESFLSIIFPDNILLESWKITSRPLPNFLRENFVFTALNFNQLLFLFLLSMRFTCEFSLLQWSIHLDIIHAYLTQCWKEVVIISIRSMAFMDLSFSIPVCNNCSQLICQTPNESGSLASSFNKT